MYIDCLECVRWCIEFNYIYWNGTVCQSTMPMQCLQTLHIHNTYPQCIPTYASPQYLPTYTYLLMSTHNTYPLMPIQWRCCILALGTLHCIGLETGKHLGQKMSCPYLLVTRWLGLGNKIGAKVKPFWVVNPPEWLLLMQWGILYNIKDEVAWKSLDIFLLTQMQSGSHSLSHLLG